MTTDEEEYLIEVSWLRKPALETDSRPDRRQTQRRMAIGRRTRRDRRDSPSGQPARPPRARLDRRTPGERRRLPDRRIGSGAARELSQIDFSELDG